MAEQRELGWYWARTLPSEPLKPMELREGAWWFAPTMMAPAGPPCDVFDRILPPSAAPSQPQQQDMDVETVLDAEPGQPSNPAVARDAEAMARALARSIRAYPSPLVYSEPRQWEEAVAKDIADALTTYATAYAMREREACAQVAERQHFRASRSYIAAAIRARSPQTTQEGR